MSAFATHSGLDWPETLQLGMHPQSLDAAPASTDRCQRSSLLPAKPVAPAYFLGCFLTLARSFAACLAASFAAFLASLDPGAGSTAALWAALPWKNYFRSGWARSCHSSSEASLEGNFLSGSSLALAVARLDLPLLLPLALDEAIFVLHFLVSLPVLRHLLFEGADLEVPSVRHLGLLPPTGLDFHPLGPAPPLALDSDLV